MPAILLDTETLLSILLDLRLNWSQAAYYATGKQPSFEWLSEFGVQLPDLPNTVFVPMSKINQKHVRDFLYTANVNYQFYGRFDWRSSEFRSTRTLIGLTFVFEDECSAIQFRLFI